MKQKIYLFFLKFVSTKRLEAKLGAANFPQSCWVAFQSDRLILGGAESVSDPVDLCEQIPTADILCGIPPLSITSQSEEEPPVTLSKDINPLKMSAGCQRAENSNRERERGGEREGAREREGE